MRPPATRLRVLLLLALLGVLVLPGLVAGAVAGPAGVAGWAVLALGLVVAGVVAGRRALRPAPPPAGRTCACCTTTQLDPVEVR